MTTPARLVLVDSSAFLSLEDRDEPSHRRSTAAFEALVTAGARMLTTNFVFDETYTLLLTRLSRSRAIAWGQSLLSGALVQLIRVESEHERRAWEILLQFEDKSFSYTDATSFAVAEHLSVADAFALDRHFRQFGRFRIVP